MNASNPTQLSVRHARIALRVSRALLLLAALALLGAWLSEWRGGELFGLSQQHLFNDATVLALLGIGGLIDTWFHERWPSTL